RGDARRWCGFSRGEDQEPRTQSPGQGQGPTPGGLTGAGRTAVRKADRGTRRVTASGSTGGRGQVHTAVGRKFSHVVLTQRLTDVTATAAHDQGIGDHVRRLVTYPADQLTVGDTGRGEEHVVGGDQVVGVQDTVQVVPGLDRVLPLGLVLGPQLALDGTVQTLHRTRGDDALRGTADPQQQIHTGSRTRRHDGTGHITVLDELDPGPRRTYLVHDLFVPRPVQDDHRHVLGGFALGAGDRAHVVAHRCGDVHHVGGLGPHRELFHVEHRGGVEHGVAGTHRDHRDRVRHTHRGQSGAVDRVDRHVPLVTTTVTDALAVVQHGRVVLLALPDDHGAVHRHGADHVPHAAYGGIVRTVLVALAHPAGRRQRGRLRD